MIDPKDTLIQAASAELTAAMRELDGIAASIALRGQALLQGHILEQGWSTETHDIAFDIKTGLFTVASKIKAEVESLLGETPAPTPETPSDVNPA